MVLIELNHLWWCLFWDPLFWLLVGMVFIWPSLSPMDAFGNGIAPCHATFLALMDVVEFPHPCPAGACLALALDGQETHGWSGVGFTWHPHGLHGSAGSFVGIGFLGDLHGLAACLGCHSGLWGEGALVRLGQLENGYQWQP